MKTNHIIMMVVLGACVGALLGIAGSSRKPDSSDARKLTKLRDYCNAVYVSLEGDANDLSSGDPARQQKALERFGNLVTYHSEQEIELCSPTKPHLDSWTKCYVDKDYKCLAKLAEETAALTKQ